MEGVGVGIGWFGFSGPLRGRERGSGGGIAVVLCV